MFTLNVREMHITLHGLGDPEHKIDKSEEPFWLSPAFASQVLDDYAASGARVPLNVTFDDGNASDLKLGVPMLLSRGLVGTIFVLAGRLGQRGYLTRNDIRELLSLGMKVGTHGMDHLQWDRISSADLAREIDLSIDILQGIAGEKIDSVSLPFGRYNSRVLKALHSRGIAKVFSSDGGPKLTGSIPIPRLTLRREMNAADVVSRIQSSARLSSRAIVELRVQAKSLRR